MHGFIWGLGRALDSQMLFYKHHQYGSNIVCLTRTFRIGNKDCAKKKKQDILQYTVYQLNESINNEAQLTMLQYDKTHILPCATTIHIIDK